MTPEIRPLLVITQPFGRSVGSIVATSPRATGATSNREL
ncbi:hypothetical protein I547_4210 [Mycobacterium kansasii 824]|nr:hypothetical protein I547_4210 [Mycobacterium kansasii 824]